jgi:hypothetical protein
MKYFFEFEFPKPTQNDAEKWMDKVRHLCLAMRQGCVRTLNPNMS